MRLTMLAVFSADGCVLRGGLSFAMRLSTSFWRAVLFRYVRSSWRIFFSVPHSASFVTHSGSVGIFCFFLSGYTSCSAWPSHVLNLAHSCVASSCSMVCLPSCCSGDSSAASWRFYHCVSFSGRRRSSRPSYPSISPVQPGFLSCISSPRCSIIAYSGPDCADFSAHFHASLRGYVLFFPRSGITH